MNTPPTKPTIRPWRCRPSGHIIGYVTRQHGMTVLLIYPPGDAANIKPLAIINGHATLPCPVCACEREWYPGEESLRALLERLDRRLEKLIEIG